jgi:hypothetical protein
MAPGIAANAPVALWYRVERTRSRAGVSPAEVQRLSQRTVTPTTLDRLTKPSQEASLQLRVLRLGFFQDGDVGVGVFPES